MVVMLAEDVSHDDNIYSESHKLEMTGEFDWHASLTDIWGPFSIVCLEKLLVIKKIIGLWVFLGRAPWEYQNIMFWLNFYVAWNYGKILWRMHSCNKINLIASDFRVDLRTDYVHLSRYLGFEREAILQMRYENCDIIQSVIEQDLIILIISNVKMYIL